MLVLLQVQKLFGKPQYHLLALQCSHSELEQRLLDQLSERLQASVAQLREEMAGKVSGGATTFVCECYHNTPFICMCFRAELIHARSGHFCVRRVCIYKTSLIANTCGLRMALNARSLLLFCIATKRCKAKS